MYAELAQYIAPKRKALERSAEPGLIERLLAQIEDLRRREAVVRLTRLVRHRESWCGL